MAAIVPREDPVEALVQSLEEIPPSIAAVVDLLQLLSSEHEPKAMALVLLAAADYVQTDLPSVRKLLRLIRRPFEAASHFSQPQFHATLLELGSAFRAGENEVRKIMAAHRQIANLATSQQRILQQQQQHGVREVQEDLRQQPRQQQQHQWNGSLEQQCSPHLELNEELQQSEEELQHYQWIGDIHLHDSPSSHPISHALLLSFFTHLRHLACTAVEVSKRYLSLAQQLSCMLQALQRSTATPLTAQVALESLHSALACREKRVDEVLRSLCLLQGQVEAEVGDLQEAVRFMEEEAARAAAARDGGWNFWGLLGGASDKGLHAGGLLVSLFALTRLCGDSLRAGGLEVWHQLVRCYYKMYTMAANARALRDR